MLWVLAGSVLALGLAFVVAGNGMRRRAGALDRSPERAEAVVTRVRRHWWPMLLDPLGGPVARPVVRFTTPAGAQIEAEVGWGDGPAVARAGDAVTVVFDPQAPGNVRIDDPRGGAAQNGVVVILCGAGLGAVAVLLAVVAAATS